MWLIIRLLILLVWATTTLLRVVHGEPAGAAQITAQPWLIADVAALSNALPAAHSPEAIPPSPADPAELDAWNEPASAWMELALRFIAADDTPPPRAARDLMLLGVALHDGILAADHARAAGTPISDDALLAVIAPRILAYTHPIHAETAQRAAAPATWAGVWRGAAAAEMIRPSQELGTAVAAAVLDWAAADGADTPVGELQPPLAEPGRWAPTPPWYEAAQLPQWGAVRTVAIGDPVAFRAAAPPAWDDPAMHEEYRAFETAQNALSADDRALADAWAAGAGTVTPPGMWMQRAIGLVRQERLATPAAAHVYAALGVALHDAAVACWESKYHYQVARPIQWLAVKKSDWKPHLLTPPHPSYPSGHASFSGAASTVLAAFFPVAADQLAAEARSAAWSRVVGGIHWPMDGVAGLAQGRAVAERVLEHALR
jgi:hypothetical protein